MTALVVEACRAINLARRIRVAVADQLTSPAVVGVLVPTLILPLTLFTTLTPEQIRFVLLHELAHIRRGDYLANLFQLFAEALLFFNPAVWWISHQIRREREACCDALAIELSGAPADYAKTLVRVAENMLQPAPTAAVAFGEDEREPSSLADRVQRLLVPGYRPSLRLTWRAMLTSLIVGGTLLVLSAIGTRNTVGAILTSNQPPTSPVLLAPETDEDVLPTVPADGYPVQPLIPTLTEFVGYDLATAATFVPTAITGTNQSSNSVLPLPIFRVRAVTTSNIVDKASFLADLPLLGQLFTSESSRTKENLGPVSTTNHDRSPGTYDWAVTGDEPLNEQWFWYLGETGRNQRNSTTNNTATAEPLHERVFNVDLGLFYAALRKSAGLSETVTGTNLFSAVRSYFTNAGVNVDPASGRGLFLSTSRGDMWVRATLPELDAIEALLRQMPGTPLTRRNYHFDSNILAKVTAVLSPEINSIVATNPAAGFRTLLESFDRTDPRPKQIRYLAEREEIYARATAADFKQFESALKETLAVKPAPELKRPPESSSNTNLSAHASSTNSPIEKLYTREFTLPVNLAYEKILTNFSQVELNSISSSNQVTAMHESFRAWFTNAGVNLDPQRGKSFFYNDRGRGSLFVRASMVELDTIETSLRTLVMENALPTVMHPKSGSRIKIGSLLAYEAFDYPVGSGSSGGFGYSSPWRATGTHRDFRTDTAFDLNSVASNTFRARTGAGKSASIGGQNQEPGFWYQVGREGRVPTNATPANQSLATRTFAVGPLELIRALERTGPVIVTNTAELVAACLARAGVDLQPPKSVFFKDPLGLLLVRATTVELDAFEQFLTHENREPGTTNPAPLNPAKGNSAMTPSSSTNLHTRTFAVDAIALVQALEQRLGPLSSGAKPEVTKLLPALRQFFATVGVDLELPKAVYLNERKGEMFVRATLTDLDAIETLLEVLNFQSPQVNLKVRWIEVKESEEHMLSQGVLSEEQTADLIQRLKQKQSYLPISEGQVTTLSTRQAQVQVAEVKTVVTNIKPEALSAPGIVATNATDASALNAQPMLLGPLFDVIPCVSSDQDQIALHIEATTKEFLGYDKSPQVSVFINGNKRITTLPLPRYLVRQITNECVLRDGQTMVLGGLSGKEIVTLPNGGTMETDVTAARSSLYILVTATLIDPAGNRLNQPK